MSDLSITAALDAPAATRPTGIAARAELLLAAMLGFAPYLGYVRAQPSPGFWEAWAAVSIGLVWLAIAPPSRRGWSAGVGIFGGVAAILLVHLVMRFVPMPVEVLVSVAVLALAAALCARFGEVAATEHGRRLVDAFAIGLLGAALMNAVSVLLGQFGYEWQLIALYPADPPVRAVGLIGQSNHLATLAVLGLAAALQLRLRGRVPRAVPWLAALAASLVVAASSSRVGMFEAVAVLALAFLWLRPVTGTGPRPLGRRELAAMALVFALVQVAWVWNASRGPVGDGAAAATPLIARSDAGRAALWRDAVALWAEHPVLGVGHGNYAAARLHELTGPLPAPHADHAHNLLLQAASEWGVAGVVLVVLAAFWLLRLVLRRLRDPQRDADGWLAAAWVVAMLVHSVAEHPLWFPYFLLPFAAMVGVLARPAAGAAAMPARRIGGGATLALATTALAVVVVAVAAADFLRLQRLVAEMRADARRPAGEARQVQLADVARIENLTLYPRPATLLLSISLPLGGEAAAAKLEVARRAMDAIPSAPTIARWAVSSHQAGRADEARALLGSIATRNPDLYANTHARLRGWAEREPRLAAFVAALPPPR
jgi:O-antigen ligase